MYNLIKLSQKIRRKKCQDFIFHLNSNQKEELLISYHLNLKRQTKNLLNVIIQPMDIIFNIESAYVKEMLSRPFSGKLVQLKASEWEFVDFDPELDLSFNENLSNAMNERIEEIDWLGIEYNNNTLAKVINNYKFPVQIISNPNFEPTDFLAIELVSAAQR